VLCEERAIERLQELNNATFQQLNDTLRSQIRTTKSEVSDLSSQELNNAALQQLNDTLQSQIQTLKSEISDLSSRMNTVGSQVQTVQSQTSSLSSRMDTVGSQLQTVRTGYIRRCRVCFRETENANGQCNGSRNTCSGWSSSPSWTSSFRDDTDWRWGGCTYQWRLECV